MKAIVKMMSCIVEDVMTSFQSDFEEYDKPYIEKADESKFPMIWIVGKSHTYLLKLGEYKDWFFNQERIRYEYAQGLDTFSFYLETLHESDRIWYLASDDIREISVPQAREIVRDVITPVVCEWEEKNGGLPKRFKVRVSLMGITTGELKRLVRECNKHGDDSLMRCLKRFHSYRQVATDHKIEVYYNRGFIEFGFCEIINGRRGLCGGIVFHGWPETGYKTNNSVQLEPRYGWAIHT